MIRMCGMCIQLGIRKKKNLRSDCIISLFQAEEIWEWGSRRRKSLVTSPPTHFTRLILNEACNLTVILRILIFFHASFHLNAYWLDFTQVTLLYLSHSPAHSLSLLYTLWPFFLPLSVSIGTMCLCSSISTEDQYTQVSVLLYCPMKSYRCWKIPLKLKPTCHDDAFP